MTKPHIKYYPHTGFWDCRSEVGSGIGKSALEAWNNYEFARRTHEALEARGIKGWAKENAAIVDAADREREKANHKEAMARLHRAHVRQLTDYYLGRVK